MTSVSAQSKEVKEMNKTKKSITRQLADEYDELKQREKMHQQATICPNKRAEESRSIRENKKDTLL